MTKQQVRRVKTLKKPGGAVARRYLDQHSAAFTEALTLAIGSMGEAAGHWSTATEHLLEIRDRKLYLLVCPSMGQYADEHLGINKRRMNQLIAHGRLMAEIAGEGKQLKERQSRVVAELPDTKSRKAAVEGAEQRAEAEGSTEVKLRHVEASVAEVRDDLDREKRPEMTSLERAVEQEAPLIEMQKSLKAMIQMATAVAAAPPGKYLHMQSFEQHMNDAWAALKFARPYGMCPYCGGDRCDKCRNSGWMPRNVFTAVPKDLQKEAAHR